MRTFYLIVIAVLAVFTWSTGKMAFARYASETQVATFFVSLVALVTMFSVLLLSASGKKFSNFWPVRMVRLWAKAKEADLQKRAED